MKKNKKDKLIKKAVVANVMCFIAVFFLLIIYVANNGATATTINELAMVLAKILAIFITIIILMVNTAIFLTVKYSR